MVYRQRTNSEKVAEYLQDMTFREMMALAKHLSDAAINFCEEMGKPEEMDAGYFAELLLLWADDNPQTPDDDA